MCQIIDLKCEGGCGRLINTHIGDYCVPAKSVSAWCGHCVPKVFRSGLVGSHIKGKRLRAIRRKYRGRYMLYEGIPHTNQPAFDCLGGSVLFVCDDPEAYHVYLNVGVNTKGLAASMDNTLVRRKTTLAREYAIADTIIEQDTPS